MTPFSLSYREQQQLFEYGWRYCFSKKALLATDAT